MAKFYTCRAVTDPQERELGKRLCLTPTVDGLNCREHAGVGHGLPLVKRDKTVTCAPVAEVPEPVAAGSEPETPRAAERFKPIWPLNDDGSACTPPPHIVLGYVETQEAWQ